MITHSFYIKENELIELQSFIKKKNLISVRFRNNPLKTNKNSRGELLVDLDMNVEDANKLNELHNKWHDEDYPPKEKMNIFNRICKLFKFK